MKTPFTGGCMCGAIGQRAIADLLSIMAGSLDDPSEFRPAMDLYTASARPWDYLNPDLPKFPQFLPPNFLEVTS